MIRLWRRPLIMFRKQLRNCIFILLGDVLGGLRPSSSLKLLLILGMVKLFALGNTPDTTILILEPVLYRRSRLLHTTAFYLRFLVTQPWGLYELKTFRQELYSIQRS